MSTPVWRQFQRSPVPASTDGVLDVLIVGAGPVGLTLALDLAQRGQRVTILNRIDFIPAGSKAICFAKRTLDIWDRLGVAAAMIAQGVVWNLGKVFWGERSRPIFEFDLLPVKSQKNPAFINLQQYHAETILVEALLRLPNVDFRWGHTVCGLDRNPEGFDVRIDTPDGSYLQRAKWLLACDGHRSPVRNLLQLGFAGRTFEDNFLIADIRLKDDRPAERWFWFDPPFNPRQSALLHKQPDDVWRLDFQLGWDIDRQACILPENVEPLVRGMLGPDALFSQVWYSVYTFQCCRMERFVHGHAIFAGDSAHLVSPFGARGCNGGISDADNLGWKLDLILRGQADIGLLESYNTEAVQTADENIQHSTRSTDFMTPKNAASRAFRDAVLELAADYAFARPFVNSGRLSTAVSYTRSPLSTPDEPGSHWRGIPPGSPAVDAPVGNQWLLGLLGGQFALLTHGWMTPPIPGVKVLDLSAMSGDVSLAIERFDLTRASAYLIRPDQYVAARWRAPTLPAIQAALARAKGST